MCGVGELEWVITLELTTASACCRPSNGDTQLAHQMPQGTEKSSAKNEHHNLTSTIHFAVVQIPSKYLCTCDMIENAFVWS